MTCPVKRLRANQVDALVPLFDAYRSFYDQRSDLSGAATYLTARLAASESDVLIAVEGESIFGFCQLYKGFSSVRLAPIMVLNDLFVGELARRRGIGTALVDAAEALARARGVKRIVLETDASNTSAQALYRRRGWVANTSTLLFERSFEPD